MRHERWASTLIGGVSSKTLASWQRAGARNGRYSYWSEKYSIITPYSLTNKHNINSDFEFKLLCIFKIQCDAHKARDV